MAKTPLSRKRRVVTPYSIFRVMAITLICAGFLGPLLWMLLGSLKSNVDIYDPSKMFQFTPVLSNYVTVFAVSDYGKYLFNSVWVSTWSTGLSLLIGVPAAYAMGKFNMRRSATTVLVARIIPGIGLVVPWYYAFANMGMVGTYTVQVLAQMFVLVPVCLYIMMSFFEGLPIELEEAGLVDGLTHIGAFYRIMLPLSVPGLATAGILAFILAWNNFMFPLVLADSSTKTLPVGVFDFVSYATIDWGAIMAAASIMTLPILIVAFAAQKYIVTGLTAGATKS